MKDRILKIKRNPINDYFGWTIIFTYLGNKFALHTREEKEYDYLPQLEVCLSEVVISDKGIYFNPLNTVKENKIEDYLKEQFDNKRVYCHYDYDFLIKSIENKFKKPFKTFKI